MSYNRPEYASKRERLEAQWKRQVPLNTINVDVPKQEETTGPRNSFSLAATLELFPDLRDSYIPDSSKDGQKTIENLTNYAGIVRRIATTVFDPTAIDKDEVPA